MPWPSSFTRSKSTKPSETELSAEYSAREFAELGCPPARAAAVGALPSLALSWEPFRRFGLAPKPGIASARYAETLATERGVCLSHDGCDSSADSLSRTTMVPLPSSASAELGMFLRLGTEVCRDVDDVRR